MGKFRNFLNENTIPQQWLEALWHGNAQEWLIFADHLEEQNHPWAEFIRLSSIYDTQIRSTAAGRPANMELIVKYNELQQDIYENSPYRSEISRNTWEAYYADDPTWKPSSNNTVTLVEPIYLVDHRRRLILPFGGLIQDNEAVLTNQTTPLNVIEVGNYTRRSLYYFVSETEPWNYIHQVNPIDITAVTPHAQTIIVMRLLAYIFP